MNTWIAWITPLHTGIPVRHEISAASREQARDVAEDLAVCLYPLCGFALIVRLM